MQAAKKPERERKVTYYAKEATRCPVCETAFHREELFSGRVNSDKLSDELHRTYKPLQAYGEVYPLIYEIEVCPSCFFAANKADFTAAGTKFASVLRNRMEYRIKEVQGVFSKLDYQTSRNLYNGCASYYLALLCYDSFSKEFSPTIKSAVASVRAAWLCNELHAKKPEDNWDYMAGLFYRKARFFYRLAIELEQSGKEIYSSARNLGPDTDKNYGHEGVLYMASMLELKYGPTENSEQRIKNLNAAKIAIARMFGLGKKNKAKPGPLLEKSRDLYDKLKIELKEGDDDD